MRVIKLALPSLIQEEEYKWEVGLMDGDRTRLKRIGSE